MIRRYGAILTGALSFGSCTDSDYACDDTYVYECVELYDVYYGYYLDCFPVRRDCSQPAPTCDGSDCSGNRDRACKSDDDCEPGQSCSGTGVCSKEPGSSKGGEDGGADDSGSAREAPDASVPDASRRDAGHFGSGGMAGKGNASGGDAGANSSAGGTSASGGSGPGGGNAEGGATGAAGNGGATGGRIRRFNFPCVRDTQCGPGLCSDGECFNACTRDEDCGTSDRCSVESGRRLCMEDPNPEVRCQQSADCASDQTCLNGACHDPCDVDTDCVNPQDRCMHNLCIPDRRPMVECVLNVECADGLVCLDSRCVNFDAL